MIYRKKKILLIQLFLLIFAILIIYKTYYVKDSNDEEKIISKTIKKKVLEQNSSENGDIFFDIEYTGLDLNGNRYVLKSKIAKMDELYPEIINMEVVHSVFYFKDDTILNVWSDKGVYNNKTLDMKFRQNVKAKYMESNLFAEKADYSNSKNYLSVYENVRLDDIRGNLIADKLIFDIVKKKLDITSFQNGKINANLKLNEKRF
jgi:hypothetical protein